MPKTIIAITKSVEEGPYYKPGSPERTNIAAPGTPGTRLTITGRVFDTAGKPVPHAWLDFWNADDAGIYDNNGFNLRGHQYADKSGRYRLETIVPHLYLTRAPHIHAKVRAKENSPVLTTQLFFPGEASNKTDSLFEPRTLMEIKEAAKGRRATFDFVVET